MLSLYDNLKYFSFVSEKYFILRGNKREEWEEVSVLGGEGINLKYNLFVL